MEFITKPYCSICGRPLTMGRDYGLVCVYCLNSKYYFNKSLSVFVYNKVIAKAIYEFKFHEKIFLAHFFAQFLAIKFKDINKINLKNNIDIKINNNNIDYVIPVPMHIKRLRKKGFNQSLLLVKEFSKITNIPFIYDLLKKNIYTKPQVNMNSKTRKNNVKSSFILNEKYKDMLVGKNILIIDDVVTTCSTINECSKVLKKNKVNKVFALSIAKTNKKMKTL